MNKPGSLQAPPRPWDKLQTVFNFEWAICPADRVSSPWQPVIPQGAGSPFALFFVCHSGDLVLLCKHNNHNISHIRQTKSSTKILVFFVSFAVHELFRLIDMIIDAPHPDKKPISRHKFGDTNWLRITKIIVINLV